MYGKCIVKLFDGIFQNDITIKIKFDVLQSCRGNEALSCI